MYNDIDNDCRNECDIQTNEGCVDGLEKCTETTVLMKGVEVTHSFCECQVPENDRDPENPDVCGYEPSQCHDGNGIDCNGHGKCVVLPGASSKSCLCNIKYAGEFCQEPRTCSNGHGAYQKVCLNDGKCKENNTNTVGYHCDCTIGFYGQNCELIHPCHPLKVS